MKLCAIASGSSGNAFYIEDKKTGILIDAGLSMKQILKKMDEKLLNPGNLKGVFITHEHSDHIKGADVIARHLNIPIYATKKTISNSSLIFSKAKINEILCDDEISIGKMKITAFPKFHSAAEPVSYLVKGSNKKTAGIITDIGHSCKRVSEAISDSDFLFLESNHDVEMLEKGPYLPWHKKWILSNEGHLSNLQASLSVLAYAKQNLNGVVLSHLSKVNNTPALALKTFKNILKERSNFNPSLHVSVREVPTQVFELSTD